MSTYEISKLASGDNTYILSDEKSRDALVDMIDNGPKNIANWSANTSTISGVTFNINSDGTVSTSGTASIRGQKGLDLTIPSTFGSGRYVLSGCPSGGVVDGTIKYCLYLWDTTAGARVASGNDTGDGLAFDWVPDPTHTYSITIDIRAGTNTNGLVFTPMICPESVWKISDKTVPYRPTNDGLARSALVRIIDDGPKNVLEMTQTQTSITRYGVTATYDKEKGIVTLNGSHVTSDSPAIFEFYSGNASDQREIPPGTYHMSGCPSGGSTNSYRASLNGISGVDIGNGAFFTISENKYLAYRILISGNCTFDNMVFRPMVCPEELYKISDAFQPYRPSYQELYEMVKALQS
jgi:hypothetical protein